MDPQAGADESVDWRDKYQKALQQLTELEREQADEHLRLRRALSRLSLAADGQDSGLDRLLEQLRQQLRVGGVRPRAINRFKNRDKCTANLVPLCGI